MPLRYGKRPRSESAPGPLEPRHLFVVPSPLAPPVSTTVVADEPVVEVTLRRVPPVLRPAA